MSKQKLISNTLSLRIVLKHPPEGVDFGLQKGKGSAYETIQKQRSGTGDLNFSFDIALRTKKSREPDFSGPFVQGTRGERFVYLDIGSYAGQSDSQWSRRLKIPLSGISNKIIEVLQKDTNKLLETKIPGTGKDGGPSCGTLKPFDGWKIV